MAVYRRFAVLCVLLFLSLLPFTAVSQSTVVPSCLITFTANDGVVGGFSNVSGSFRVDVSSYNPSDSSYLVIPSTVSATGANAATYLGLNPGMYFTNDNKLFNITATATAVNISGGMVVDSNGLGLIRTTSTFNQSILIFNNQVTTFGAPSGIVVKDQAFLFSGPVAAAFSINGCSANVNVGNTGSSSASTGIGVRVSGDPHFVGLRAQSFQVHGIDGAVYNLISDTSFNLNSRFVFLAGPHACPLLPSTGKKSSVCFSHAGSYLGEIGLVTVDGQQIFIRAGAASSGFAAISVNQQQLKLGSSSTHSAIAIISYNSSHEATITVGRWRIEVENSDRFLNLRSVSVSGALSSLGSHGLLGQTWQNKRYKGGLKEIEGRLDDYMVNEDDVFGSSFLFNKYSPSQ